MYDTPASMLDICVDFICTNIKSFYDAQPGEFVDNRKMQLVESGVYFPGNISEQILETLCQRASLTDESMSFFQSDITRLQRVNITNARLTRKGLKILKQHKISELKVSGLKNITVNDLIGCLGEWTLSNLRSLNVSCSTFVNNSKFCVVVSLSKLRNLVSLNVSNTEFDNHGLKIITDDLPNLENIDISESSVNDITVLTKCKHRLKSLSMYNVRLSGCENVIPVLLQLTNLRVLDISDDFNIQPFVDLRPAKFNIVDLLSDEKCLPNIKSLDISGKEEISENCLVNFLSQHSDLQFMGLALTDVCHCSVFTDQHSPQYLDNIVVTGDASESQILECLRRYVSRSTYIHKSLFNLFSHTMNIVECRQDIIDLILEVMAFHEKQLGVQMAATACLYNLTKGSLSQKLHPRILRKVVTYTLDAMQNFPRHQQLQKNALLTICNDRVLQDVVFERYRCAEVVMECLCSFDDQSMTRMSVAICSILAAKITTKQTALVGAKPRYMQKMLDLVTERITNSRIDMTLKFTLSALWNLTDESPPTCSMFLMEEGLELFMRVLEHVQDMPDEERVPVETKVLGLLNNISEVDNLRQSLLREDFIMVVSRLLHSDHIDVSYFAAGIVAYLTSDKHQLWTLSGTSRQHLLQQLREEVLRWKQPDGEMVAYRSFRPFFPLLLNHETTPVQLWAIWAIQHVCIKNATRYCNMLNDEGGGDILMTLLSRSTIDPEVAAITENVMELLRHNVRGFNGGLSVPSSGPGKAKSGLSSSDCR